MSIIRSESGTTLDGWTMVVGDGLYHAADEAPVELADLRNNHRAGSSMLKANIRNRRIMAHNITYHKIVDPVAMTSTHEANYEFRIPYEISTGNTTFNGQTVEGGLFVWDGPDTRLDYGLAFQWVLNPWAPDYKSFYYWNGSGWSTLGYMEPDTRNHTIKFTLDPANKIAYITLNGFQFLQNVFSETPKGADWGTTVDARFQAEIISIFPPETGSIPKHKVRFKNWCWQWSDVPLVVPT